MCQAVSSRSWVVNEENRQQLLKDALSVYENAIQCAINLGNYSQAIATLKQRARELYQQQSKLDNQSEEWLQLSKMMQNMSGEIKDIEFTHTILQKYCAIDRPFASPYYWAAFVTQGMA